MKIKQILLIVTVFLILAPIIYAVPPTAPAALLPLNETSLDYIPEFSWINSSDADNDTIDYILEFANDSSFIRTLLTSNTTTSLNSTTPVLPSQGIFYWHIIATDGPSNSSASQIRQFIYDITKPSITNETNTPNPSFNTSDVTLTAIITDNLDGNITTNIDSAWVETDYAGMLLNYTAKRNQDIYSYFIEDRNFTTNQSIIYTFYANDSVGNEIKGASKIFYVNGTLLFINPALPDGLNSWYITNPSIELKTNLDSNNITYKWDELQPSSYTSQFNASIVLPIGGNQVLKYWSADVSKSIIEPQKNFSIKIDVTSPRIISTYPLNSSTIGEQNPLISASMDDVYFDNSLVNKSSIRLVFDDMLVNASSITGNSTVNLSYQASSLSNGLHNISITAMDYAGNTKNYNWSFALDIIPINLAVNNPINISYDAISMKINLSSDKTVDFYRSLDGSSYSKICNDCQDFEKMFSFPQGSHFLSIKAVNGASNEDIKNISFFIDSIEPNIFSTKPDDEARISQGNFSIIYNEINLKSVNLYYKENTTSAYSNISLPCSPSTQSTTNQDCSLIIDLSSSNNKGIDYFFAVSDGLRITQSQNKTFVVDTSSPSLALISPYTSNQSMKQVRINLEAGELSTLSYIDNYTEKTLCTRCSSYNSTLNFKEGLHNITFIALDLAGNQDNKSMNIFVDSIYPVIKKIKPITNSFSNGNFSIQYSEANISKARLFFKNQTSPLTAIILPSCPSGINSDCSISLDMSSYEGQLITFFFNVSDTSRERTSKTSSATIDTTDPSLTVFSPANTTYSAQSILFSINSTEDSLISYSDNNSTFKTLCSSCSSLSVNKALGIGMHNIVIKATDKAGNMDIKIIDLTMQ